MSDEVSLPYKVACILAALVLIVPVGLGVLFLGVCIDLYNMAGERLRARRAAV